MNGPSSPRLGTRRIARNAARSACINSVTDARDYGYQIIANCTIIFFYCDLYSAIWHAASRCSRDTKRYRIIFTGNEKGAFKTRRSPPEISRVPLLFIVTLAPIYISGVFLRCSDRMHLSVPRFQCQHTRRGCRRSRCNICRMSLSMQKWR